MAIEAVGRAASDMIKEVQRQFKDIPELKAALAKMKEHGDKPVAEWPEADRKIYEAADGKAEYANCVSISTTAAIREMVKPGLLAVLTPVVVGFGFKFAMDGDGKAAAMALGGLLAGVTVSGVLLALFQANAGGAWDNAKKMFEEGKGVEVDGVYHTKGSDAHKAGVVGDTVGDPLKDTSGPSLNILLKLMTVIALVIAPLLVADAATGDGDKANGKPIAGQNVGDNENEMAGQNNEKPGAESKPSSNPESGTVTPGNTETPGESNGEGNGGS
jgi:K(+)-stimulated pyrophosphate-energized sodium pump